MCVGSRQTDDVFENISHCVNSVPMNYSGPYFPALELNTDRYSYIFPYSVRMRENTDHNNSELGHFLRSEYHR